MPDAVTRLNAALAAVLVQNFFEEVRRAIGN